MALFSTFREQFVERSAWTEDQQPSTSGQLVVHMSGRQSPNGFCKPLLLPQIDVNLGGNKDDGPPSESVLKRQKFAIFEKQCSRIMEGLYVSGEYVAKNREVLHENGITHVVNCVGAMYPEYWKNDGVQYRTLWLQDSPSEDIQCILYDTFEFIESARNIHTRPPSSSSIPSSPTGGGGSSSSQPPHAAAVQPPGGSQPPCGQQGRQGGEVIRACRDDLTVNPISGQLTWRPPPASQRPPSGSHAAAAAGGGGGGPAAAAAAGGGGDTAGAAPASGSDACPAAGGGSGGGADGSSACGGSSGSGCTPSAPGRVLVHCSQGVSRSTTIIIAYIMWKTNQAYDQVYHFVRTLRGVTSPNIGFTCQLLQWQKRRERPPTRVRIYRIAPHCADSPRYFVPRLVSPAKGQQFPDVRALDPRGCFVVHLRERLYVWVGRNCLPWLEEAGMRAALLLQKYEKAPAPIKTMQGEEPEDLILALQPCETSVGGGPDGLCGEVSGSSVGGFLAPGGAAHGTGPSSGGAELSREPSTTTSSAQSSRTQSFSMGGRPGQQHPHQHAPVGLPPRGFGANAAAPASGLPGVPAEAAAGGSTAAGGGGGGGSVPVVPALPLQQVQQAGTAAPRMRPSSSASSPRVATSQAAAAAAAAGGAEPPGSVRCSMGGAGAVGGGGGEELGAASRRLSSTSFCSDAAAAMLTAQLRGLAVVENDDYSQDYDLVKRELIKAGAAVPDAGRPFTPRGQAVTAAFLSADDLSGRPDSPATSEGRIRKVRRSESDRYVQNSMSMKPGRLSHTRHWDAPETPSGAGRGQGQPRTPAWEVEGSSAGGAPPAAHEPQDMSAS